jgi:hypothetical protein
MKIEVKRSNITISFHTKARPVPLIIMPLISVTKYFAGMMVLSHCNGQGIFSTGKIKFDKSRVGSIRANIETNIATSCELLTVEISIPRERDIII